jgi:peptidoglycan/LPS O-acetylase OafA/YrhL
MTRLKTFLLSFFKTETKSYKLEFLDGYRGFLCVTVIANHLFSDKYTVFDGAGLRIGVYGFFVMSAFLLTYRLLIDFEKALSSSSYRKIILITAHYSIRRVFRIYLPFLVYWTMHMPTHRIWEAILVLTYKDDNHLWTIPVETQYYFLIPFISFIAASAGRSWFLFCLILVTFIIVIEIFNPFDFSYESYHRNWKVTGHLTLFLKGSLTAILYYNIKKAENLNRLVINTTSQTIIYSMTWLAIIYMLRNGPTAWQATLPQPNPHFIHAEYAAFVVFFLMIFGEPNYFTEIFNNNIVFRIYGKYSYGIYLNHGIMITLYNAVIVDYADRILGPFLTLLIMCYAYGFIWFYCVENPLNKFASYVCAQLSMHSFFFESNIKRIISN